MGKNFVQSYITADFRASVKHVSTLNPKPEPLNLKPTKI